MLIKTFATSCLLALTLGSMHVARASTGEATATVSIIAANNEDVAITRRAKKMFADLRAGRVDRTQFSAAAAKALTPEAVTQVSHMLGALGVVRQFRFVEIQRAQDGAPSSLYVVKCTNGTIHYAFGLNGKGKVDVFAFQ